MNSNIGEGDYINKIDIIKENTKIPDFRIWTQKKNILSDKIFPKIIHHSNISFTDEVCFNFLLLYK